MYLKMVYHAQNTRAHSQLRHHVRLVEHVVEAAILHVRLHDDVAERLHAELADRLLRDALRDDAVLDLEQLDETYTRAS